MLLYCYGCETISSMKLIKSFSSFTKSLILFNGVVILLFSALLFDIWGKVYVPYFDTFFFLEIFVIFSTVALYFYWLFQLHKKGLQYPQFIPTLTLITVLLFAVGQHSSANQIHIFVEHPSVLFYDEYLSHWILVTTLALIGLSFSWLQLLSKGKTEALKIAEKGFLITSGIVQGFVLGIYSVEGRSGWIAGALSVLSIFLIQKWLKGRKLQNYPLPLYYIVGYVTVLIVLLWWFVKYGGFFEPSAVGFGRF